MSQRECDHKNLKVYVVGINLTSVLDRFHLTLHLILFYNKKGKERNFTILDLFQPNLASKREQWVRMSSFTTHHIRGRIFNEILSIGTI